MADKNKIDLASANQVQGALPVANAGVPASGLTGQVLAKTSNADYADAWATVPTGVGNVNSQTVSYLALTVDDGKLIAMNGASLTLTLPAAPPSATWKIFIENLNASALTVSRNGLTIDGAATDLTLTQNAGVVIFTDGTNYFTERGLGSGTVTHTGGALTIHRVVVGGGVDDVEVIAALGSAGQYLRSGGAGVDPAFAGVAESEVTNLTSDLAANEATANKDAASGYAGLDASVHLKDAEKNQTRDARTTTSEAITDGDRAKIVTFSNSSAVAATIAQAGTGGNFADGWFAILENLGAGIVTLTPTTSTVNGAATLVLAKYQSCLLLSDGTNYLAVFHGTRTIASGTSALGTSAIASGAAATVVTTSATGVLTTDTIMADFNADPTGTTGYAPSASGMLTIVKYPTADNVNFKVVNNTGASITPGAVTLNWRVVR